MSSYIAGYESLQMKSINPTQPIPLFKDMDDSMKCPKCTAIMTESMQTPCGHLFCKQCLVDVIEKHKNHAYCPAEEEGCSDEVLDFTNIYPDYSTRKKIKNLEVFCTYRQEGCERVMKWGQLDSHLEKCPYARFECPNKTGGCSEMLTQESKEKHLNQECLYRKVSCQYCKKPVTASELKKHYQTCPDFSVECPNKCTLVKFQRKELEDHLGQCIFRPKKCEYAEYGCTFKGQAHELEEHSIDKLAMQSHNTMLLNKIKTQDQEMTNMHNALKTNRDQLARFQDQLDFLTSENSAGKMMAIEQKKLVNRIQVVSAEAIEKFLALSAKLDLQKEEMSKKANLDDLTASKKELEAVHKLARDANNRSSFMNEGQTVMQLAARISVVEDRQQKYQKSIGDLRDSSHNGIFIWKIENYSKRKRDAMNGDSVSVYSSSFYVGRYGYRMRARVYLNGDGRGRGTHLSFFITIVRGEYDNVLKWPYAQKTTLMLLDQTGKGIHVVDSFLPNGTTDCFKKPETSMNLSSGTPLFAAQKVIEAPNSPYKKDDTILLKVIVDKTGLKDMDLSFEK